MARHDYQPFGEEIDRPSYGADEVRKQFTGYERDTETDLDYAQARMYNKNLGRFNSGDPIFISKEHSLNPQRWNLYIYVINNPLSLTDPDGMKPKGVVDVFIIFNKGERDNNKNPDWKRLQREAKRNGYKLNVYTSDNTSLSNKILKSLETPGRKVVLITHSFVDAIRNPNGEGVLTGKISGKSGTQWEYIGNYGIATTSNKSDKTGNPIISDNVLPEFKASSLLVFSCFPGQSFGDVLNSHLSSDSSAYYNNPQSHNGESWIGTLLNAGFTATRTLITGGTTEDAVQSANNVLSTDPFGNDDHLTNPRQVEENTNITPPKKP